MAQSGRKELPVEILIALVTAGCNGIVLSRMSSRSLDIAFVRVRKECIMQGLDQSFSGSCVLFRLIGMDLSREFNVSRGGHRMLVSTTFNA